MRRPLVHLVGDVFFFALLRAASASSHLLGSPTASAGHTNKPLYFRSRRHPMNNENFRTSEISLSICSGVQHYVRIILCETLTRKAMENSSSRSDKPCRARPPHRKIPVGTNVFFVDHDVERAVHRLDVVIELVNLHRRIHSLFVKIQMPRCFPASCAHAAYREFHNHVYSARTSRRSLSRRVFLPPSDATVLAPGRIHRGWKKDRSLPSFL